MNKTNERIGDLVKQDFMDKRNAGELQGTYATIKEIVEEVKRIDESTFPVEFIEYLKEITGEK